MGHQDRRSAWCGVWGGQGECWWWSRSAQWKWGAKIQAMEHWQGLRSAHPVEQPIQAEQCWNGREVTSLEWIGGAPIQSRGGDRGAPILEGERQGNRQYAALDGISKRHSRLRSADEDWEVPIIPEEHHQGGVWSSPTMCNYNECNGICSNSIYHRGRAKFTSIFILRKYNCNLLASGILRQRTMNSCSHKGKCLRCERLKKLRCGRLSPQAIGGEEKLMVEQVKHFHLHELGFLIIDDLWEISIVKQELRNLYSKLSLWS